MNKYLIVLPVDDMPTGSRYAAGERLPLHCTLMPWFISESEITREQEDIFQSIANECAPESLTLVSHKARLFGRLHDIPVHTLRQNKKLLLLHTELLVEVCRMGCIPQDLEFVGAGYRPHVTSAGERKFTPETSYRPEGMVLLKGLEDGRKLVVWKFPFGKAAS